LLRLRDEFLTRRGAKVNAVNQRCGRVSLRRRLVNPKGGALRVDEDICLFIWNFGSDYI